MKKDALKKFVQQTELVERLSSVTEQLEDIVTITKGKDVKEPDISLGKLSEQMKRKIGGSVPLVLFAIFRMFALKNLLRGRMHVTAYTVGRQLGQSLKINSIDDFKKEIAKFEPFEMTVKKLDDTSVKIQLQGTITSMGIKDSPLPLCYFEKGLLAGALEKLLKRKVDLIEETCCGQGDECCSFKSVLTLDKIKIRSSRSQDYMPTDLYSKENLRLLTTLASHSITAIENTFLLEEAKRQSIMDGLTKVYNHGYFQQILKLELGRSYRYKNPLALVVMDVDRFKHYNDQFGHQQGDKVLRAIASLLTDNVREVDIVARYGGDEFAIIFPQTNADGVKAIVNRIREQLKAMAFKGDAKRPEIYFTLSMGVAVSDGKKMVKPESLFAKADHHLLLAKQRGRNQVVI